MAEKCVLAKSVIDSDLFLNLPPTAQLLYFHLCMEADEQGIFNNAKAVMRGVGLSKEDMAFLVIQGFVTRIKSSGIDPDKFSITHWQVHKGRG